MRTAMAYEPAGAPTAPVHFAENPLHLAVTDRAGDNASA
jgi:hypothetical protein